MRVVSILTLLFIGGASAAFAQNIGQVDPLIEDQRQQALEQRTNELGAFTARESIPDPGPAQERGGPCFDVRDLRIEGVTLLPPAELAAIIAPYVPSCMEGADIQAVMRGIDAAYAERGYITTKTYIPAQNLTSGSLILSVVEGQVEELILLDDAGQVETARGRRQLATAFPGVKNRPFQLRDFEQGLDQMNRLASVEAVLRLQPGDHEGGSHVIVQRVQSDRFRGYLRADTLGAKSTGERRLSLDTEWDDFFGANDTWSLGYTGSLNTNALTLRGSVPYGYFTFGVDLGYSEYLTPLNEMAELFGNSHSARVDLRYMAARDQFSTTELNAALNIYRADRWINDARLTPQALTVLDIGVRRMRLDERARHSWDATLSVGLPLFGADHNISDDEGITPKAQFVKLAFGWQRQGALGNIGTMVNDMRGQFAPHALYSSQQMALGSWSTVRGYSESKAVGDSGLYLRNDLYLASDIWAGWLPGSWQESAAQRLQPHLFLDLGVTRDRARHQTETAAGAGFGMSWYGDRMTASALFGVPLISGNESQDPVLQIRVDRKLW
ncbi:MAG: ShlB/FhaC/HecB family hemolysin secretion/activation protein [Paracoccus sp. (in: a-proteobacteria)]|nr:ShlB/FhaC/HecB family hemolysin secretion/activation protein [Paracoccus sp. (in: a-proteobacteria)]